MSGPAAERAHAPPAPHKRAPPVGRSAAVRQALGRGVIQRAAVIGRADDACEREAERIARTVATHPDAPVQATEPAGAERIQRAPLPDLDEGERPGEYLVQPARLASASDPPPVPRGFDARLARLRGGGRPLPAPLRTGMEDALGEPFDTVRIHDGPEAAELAASVAARAFTTGDDIVFGAGSFDPQGSEGRALVAHELTHVVQQRDPRPGGAVAEPAPPVVQREELGILDRAALAVVEEVAPRIAPLIERGPVQWLRDQLAAAFDGIVGAFARLNLGGIVEELILVFGVMLDRATAIAQALISGDCGPLFAALAQLRDFVAEVAGRAWDRLTTLLQPVADFFTDLWNSIGAPAIQWLQEFAGDLWQMIQDLGAYLWSKVEPIKNALSAAWDWVKEQLFGPADAAEGDSQSGIIGWLTRKATEAWDWVKEQTRPVWEPVAQAVETVRSLIPPAFVAELGERMTALGGEVGAAADATGGGASVAENRAALAGILPSVSDLLAMVRERLVSAGLWLVTTVGGVAAQVATFFGRLGASSILGALAAGLGWLETAIARLAAWATEKVAGLFTWLVGGFDALTPFLQRLIETVGNVISVAGDLLRLPQLVLGAIWNLIPECIRTPITTFLTEQILARIPIFNQLTRIGALWSRLQATALTILRQAFVDGDLARAAWTFFSTMLDLIGLPAQLVVQILAKAAAAIGQILRDPVGFLINLLRALRDGFARFFGNILTHLMNGIAGWLFGRLSEAGITPPTDLSLRGILGFVMQILDITVERVLERLGRRIGPERVARIRQVLAAATGVWEFVRVLIEEGPAGLWRLLQQRLSNLWSLVLDSVVGWVSTRVIAAATQWLLSLLDPTAIMAVITSAIALYRAIESFVQYLREMLEIVSRVLDAILGIASGAIEAAAGFLENAMARTLPVAIGFLANQVGLGGLSTRIREFVEGVRERVDAALDWIIDRAIRAGQAFLALLQRGVGAVQRGVAAIREWWRARKAFRAQDGTEHSVYIAGQGATARLMVESDPETYVGFIETRPAGADKTEALDLARQLDAAIAAAARDPTATTPAPPGAQTATNHATIIQGLLDELATVTARLMPADATGPSTPPIYGGQVQGYGSVVTVARLTRPGLREGSRPSDSLPGESWNILRRRRKGGSSFYVRGHLLNHHIGGPGTTWSNLTPLTQDANNRGEESHLRGFEQHVKAAVLNPPAGQTPRAVNFVCRANYGRPARETEAQRIQSLGGERNALIASIIREETKVPQSMDCSARLLNEDGTPAGGTLWAHPVVNDQSEIEVPGEQYSVRPE